MPENTVARALRRKGIEPGRLTVEMTESVFADDLEAIRDVLNEQPVALREMGCHAARGFSLSEAVTGSDFAARP